MALRICDMQVFSWPLACACFAIFISRVAAVDMLPPAVFIRSIMPWQVAGSFMLVEFPDIDDVAPLDTLPPDDVVSCVVEPFVPLGLVCPVTPVPELFGMTPGVPVLFEPVLFVVLPPV